MRIILALAAHFKPSANQRAASGSGRGLTRGSASHNPLSPVALAQGAAAALASARLDASQPAHATCIHRYAGHNNHKHRHKAMSVSLYNILMCETCVVFAVLCWTNTDHQITILTPAEVCYQNCMPVLIYE